MHVLVDRVARNVQTLGDDCYRFLIGERPPLVEHADDAHAVSLFHRVRLLADSTDALAQKLLQLASGVLHERLLKLAAGRRQFADHLSGTHHIRDVHIDAQREVIILADDVEGRAFERPPRRGKAPAD